MAKSTAVEALKKYKVLKFNKKDQKDCQVCLEKLEKGVMVMQMPCNHEFHENCLRGWLTQHYTCPICRYELEYEEVQPNRKITAPAQMTPAATPQRRRATPSRKNNKPIQKKKKKVFTQRKSAR